jgi:hypothetical protein
MKFALVFFLLSVAATPSYGRQLFANELLNLIRYIMILYR